MKPDLQEYDMLAAPSNVTHSLRIIKPSANTPYYFGVYAIGTVAYQILAVATRKHLIDETKQKERARHTNLPLCSFPLSSQLSQRLFWTWCVRERRMQLHCQLGRLG